MSGVIEGRIMISYEGYFDRGRVAGNMVCQGMFLQ